jgi:hypothetical protein
MVKAIKRATPRRAAAVKATATNTRNSKKDQKEVRVYTNPIQANADTSVSTVPNAYAVSSMLVSPLL